MTNSTNFEIICELLFWFRYFIGFKIKWLSWSSFLRIWMSNIKNRLIIFWLFVNYSIYSIWMFNNWKMSKFKLSSRNSKVFLNYWLHDKFPENLAILSLLVNFNKWSSLWYFWISCKSYKSLNSLIKCFSQIKRSSWNCWELWNSYSFSIIIV